MSTIQTSSQNFDIDSVSFGTLTVTANAGSDTENLYPRLIGNIISSDGNSNIRVCVVAIESSGVITCNSCSGNQYETSTPVNLAAYDEGTIYFEPQLVSIIDEPLTLATTTSDGLMSKEDKTKLDSIS
jgi:hypothetical protein